VNRETLTYPADGRQMKSELFFKPGLDRRAGVLVFPEAYGLNSHALSRAERLASMGYVALACDLHGDAAVIDDLGIAVKALEPLFQHPAKTRARAAAALAALAARPEVEPQRIGAIGFCFGGTMGLELARSGAPLRAVVGFHSGLATASPPADAKAIRGKLLVCIGADDPFITPAERSAFETEMRGASGVDWQLHVYGATVHSFTNQAAARANRPDAVRYSEEADKRSWASMQALFAETLLDVGQP
jgi:dienelactone hydrolase